MKFLISIIILFQISFTQNVYDVLRPFFGFNSTQIISESIGSASAGAGYLSTGLGSNPANYALSKHAVIHTNYSSNQFNSNSSFISKSGFNGIDLVIPIDVYQGSLSISLGGHRHIDFLAASNSNSTASSEEGGLSSYHIGAAVEFSKGVFIGGDIKFLSGQDKMLQTSSSNILLFNPHYEGTEISIGMLHTFSRNIQYGISIDLPSSLNVRDKFTYSDLIEADSSFSDIWYYNVKKPTTFHVGASILLKNINLFYEFEFTDWHHLKFSSSTIYQGDIPASIFINEEIRENLVSTSLHHFGIGYHFNSFPLHLYAGYEYLPTPFQGQYENDLRENYSGGFSIMMQKNISLQGSYNKYSWIFEGEPESYEKFSIGISFHSLKL